MNRLLAMGAVLALASISTGCNESSEGKGAAAEDAASGKMAMPLRAYGSSGAEYRLRNAEFGIWGYNYDGCWGTGGAAGYPGGCDNYQATVSSEDYLEEDTIVLDLLRGDYEISLNDGWQLERTLDGETEVVDAVLLNGNYQWVWVEPYSTTWVSFQFGVGDEELWFNGQVNLSIDVYEDPDDYYHYYNGEGGYPGEYWTGAAGAATLDSD